MLQAMRFKDQAKRMDIARNLSIKEKRRVFTIIRRHHQQHGNNNILFPKHGALTLAEFCTFYVVLTDNRRKKPKSTQATQPQDTE